MYKTHEATRVYNCQSLSLLLHSGTVGTVCSICHYCYYTVDNCTAIQMLVYCCIFYFQRHFLNLSPPPDQL